MRVGPDDRTGDALNNPAILFDLKIKFTTIEMRSHRKENRFVGQLKTKIHRMPIRATMERAATAVWSEAGTTS
jgi:hypothetical protein